MSWKPLSLIALGIALVSSTDASAQQVGQVNPATTSPSPVSHQDVSPSRCAEGTPWRSETSVGHPARPLRTANCPYGLDEFIERVTNLSIDKNAVDSVETAEKVFGVPTMTTFQDDPRVSNYRTMMIGQNGWMSMLSVSEGFYPSNKGPVRFVPGMHPKRLYDVRDAKLRISLQMSGPSLYHQTCIPVTPFFDALTKAGWKEMPQSPKASVSDMLMHPKFQYGDKGISVQGVRGSCTQDIELTQEPKKT